ncbi:hypothetical protein QTN47_08500 [Danxiaibacter flavus]|uniref:Uncharacterized protein n=1 Tax=Danxiaibacter flavus TaxID=3049108 RepID=A0ABV3ZCB7_9BACT|nr:hypothetical protein QNM32_08500 [Chitinophagaceae bacterium DXS]
MKTKNLVTLTLVISLLTIFTACQKVADIQPEKPVLPGLNVTESNWGFQLPDSSFAGVVDTAYTVSSEGVNNIVIQGSDTAGNLISIMLSTKEKKFIKDAYTSLYGRAFISFQTDTFYYASYKDSGSFTFEITKITDSVIEGNYKAVLLDKASHKMITLKSGTIKALLNLPNNNGSVGPVIPSEPEDNDPTHAWKINDDYYQIDTVYRDKRWADIYYVLAVESPNADYWLEVIFQRDKPLEDGIYTIKNGGEMGEFDVDAVIYKSLGDNSYYEFGPKEGTIKVSTVDGKKVLQFSNMDFAADEEHKIVSITFTAPKF